MPKQTIKKGDDVKVLTGQDKGKSGKVLQVFPKLARVSVQGVNLMKRHLRSRRPGDKGQVVEFAMPIHISNVQLSTEVKEAKEAAPKAEKKTASRKK